ncbi:hypothetical protein FGU46_07400 [Methanobacterium sp. CWC-01]|uniref:hypothetical protein n=1 Tax=Methanobacterium aridiramus TaxID=2584467 RepID=UPI002578A22D|nr:hypothetical protein [Methanobacterium sp. CWC-01]WJI09924.1 hypothetical protein FGU46_07400 [Methanobacterium sp. CWC-01]
MEEEMMYEMRLPPGVTQKMVAQVITDFELEIKHTETGPLLYGKKENLEKAQDYIIKALNERLRELEEGHKR